MTHSLDNLLEESIAAGEPSFAQLTRTSAVFVLGAVAGKVVGLVLLPILTRLLTPAGYGSVDVLMTLGGALSATLMLGLDVAALRLWFDQPNPGARRGLIATWYAITLGMALAAGSIIAVNSGAISAALFRGFDLQPAVYAIAVFVGVNNIETIALTVLRAQGRAGWFAAINGGVLLLYAILATALLELWRADANAVILGLAAAMTVAAVVGTLVVREAVIGRPAVTAARELLRLGLPLAPAVASSLVGDFLNRTILLAAAGAAQVAYFTVAWRFATVAGLAVVGFQLAWQPRAYALGTSERARARLAADSLWIVAIVCAIVVGLAVASPEILVFAAGAEYVAALPALGFCLVAMLGMVLFLVASLPSAIARATHDLGLAIGASVVAVIAGNLILAPIWHSTGTAAAVAGGQLVAVTIVRHLGMRRMFLPVDWAKLGRMVALTGLVVLVLLVGDLSLLARLLVGAVALAWIAWSVPLRKALVTVRAWSRR